MKQIGPSSLYRTSLCLGSMNQERVAPETPSFGGRGTLIHGVMAFLMSSESLEHIEMAPGFESLTPYDIGICKIMFAQAMKLRPKRVDKMLVEYRTDLSQYGFLPDGRENQWQLDLAFLDLSEGLAVVIDFKSGKTEVTDLAGRLQTGTYLRALMDEYKVDRGDCHIIAPENKTPLRSYKFTKEEVQELALQTDSWLMEAKKPDAPLVPGEVQCLWCAAAKAGTCPARQDQKRQKNMVDAHEEYDRQEELAKSMKIEPVLIKPSDELKAQISSPPILISAGIVLLAQQFKERALALKIVDEATNAEADEFGGKIKKFLTGMEKRVKEINEPAKGLISSNVSEVKKVTEPLVEAYESLMAKLKARYLSEQQRLRDENTALQKKLAEERAKAQPTPQPKAESGAVVPVPAPQPVAPTLLPRVPMAPAAQRSTKKKDFKDFEVLDMEKLDPRYIIKSVNEKLLKVEVDTGVLPVGDYAWGRVFDDVNFSAKGR